MQSADSPNEQSQTVSRSPEAHNPPASPLPEAGLSDFAAAIESAVERNADLSAQAGGASTMKPRPQAVTVPDDIDLHPLKWYETDFLGRVKRRDDGSPIKRPHRPAKPKPGDKLVGGGIWTADGPKPKGGDTAKAPEAQTSAVVIDAPQSVNRDADALGPEAGEVVTEAIFNCAEAIHGDKAKPTEAERTSIKRAAGRVLGGVHLHPALALVILGGVYLLRIRLLNRKDKPRGTTTDASADRGANTEREDGLRASPGPWKYAH